MSSAQHKRVLTRKMLSLYRVIFLRRGSSRLLTTSTMAGRWTPNSYPKARRSDHVDTYQSASKGSVPVHDPYNWLEKHTEETDAWVSEQERFTRKFLDQTPHRKRLEDAFRASVDYPKVHSYRISPSRLLYIF